MINFATHKECTSECTPLTCVRASRAPQTQHYFNSAERGSVSACGAVRMGEGQPGPAGDLCGVCRETAEVFL